MPVLAKKILTWAALAFLLFFIAFRPEGAADMFRGVGGFMMAMAQGIGDFITSLMAT